MRRLFALGLVLAASLALLPGVSRAATIEEGFIRSFDGTRIHYYLFLPDGAGASNPVPVILRTHGWGGSGESTIGGTLGRLLNEGYAVLTWDQRGFGRSGGQAEIDDDEFEGRDVSSLITMVSARDEILKVAGDPVVGMTGGSYAGGIQFSAASIDDRIDALAPEIAWNDLPQALFPNNVPKLGWDVALYGVGQSGYRGYVENGSALNGHVGTLNPNIHASFWTTTVTNDPTPWLGFYAERSIANYLPSVDVPTLVMQGTIDTLFPINHGIANAAGVAANGAPVKLILFNGGHTIGSTIPGGNQRAHLDNAIVAWFAKYLKGATTVSTGAPIEWQDGTAAWHTLSALPATTSSYQGSATVAVTPAPTGGGTIVAGNPNVAAASARIPVLTGAPGGTKIVGIPTVSGTLDGVAPDAFLFFKLVDATTNTVIDDQVTPYRASVLGTPQAFSIDLNGVAWVVPAGHELVLEVSTGSNMYTSSRVPGVVTLNLTGTVPTA